VRGDDLLALLTVVATVAFVAGIIVGRILSGKPKTDDGLVGIRGAGVLHIRDVEAFLRTPEAQRQIEALRQAHEEMRAK
jgi:hypothetical protein